MKNNNALYEARDLSFSYATDPKAPRVLSDISLVVDQGQFIALSGPSGSGKTTLLNILGLIESPRSGDIQLKGKNIRTLTEAELNALRRFEIGFIFQDFQLIEVLTVEENCEYFLARQKIPRRIRKKRVHQALAEVGLWEHRHKYPGEISGGQKQRTAIARAIAKEPSVIIADEPTASLDSQTSHQIMALLQQLNETRGVTMVVASHDPLVMGYVSHEIKLRDGRIQNMEARSRHVI
jgi:ABC-type lipoprotein export system ATPase subunit